MSPTVLEGAVLAANWEEDAPLWEKPSHEPIIHIDDWTEGGDKFSRHVFVSQSSATSGMRTLWGQPDDEELEAVFYELANQWIEETRFTSDVIAKLLHPAFLRIIGLGPRVLPLILQDVPSRRADWSLALEVLAGEVPTVQGLSFDDECEAWIRWGEERGYI